jgi:hypothetical protein
MSILDDINSLMETGKRRRGRPSTKVHHESDAELRRLEREELYGISAKRGRPKKTGTSKPKKTGTGRPVGRPKGSVSSAMREFRIFGRIVK